MWWLLKDINFFFEFSHRNHYSMIIIIAIKIISKWLFLFTLTHTIKKKKNTFHHTFVDSKQELALKFIDKKRTNILKLYNITLWFISIIFFLYNCISYKWL